MVDMNKKVDYCFIYFLHLFIVCCLKDIDVYLRLALIRHPETSPKTRERLNKNQYLFLLAVQCCIPVSICRHLD